MRKIGATPEEPVDVRIISATHKDLARCVENGLFRQGLVLPPERDRTGAAAAARAARRPAGADRGHPGAAGGPGRRLARPGRARCLARVFLPGQCARTGKRARAGARLCQRRRDPVEDLSLKARAGEAGRESAALAEAAGVTASAVGTMARAEPAPASVPAVASPAPAVGPEVLPSNLPAYLEQVERDIIQRALQQTQFNRTRTASLLGISVRQLRYQMQKLDIQAPEN
ncbi:helix-turn-helix domain-containing protein [Massilia sp. Se16.2.3]|uniref:helix-turn-helix domain-containing protein n=1 Tax=Massilia sp. Se16.2.3 TaxID=2709303 RepID=UPI002804DCC0|nr:helix-turn-helix domain-containing protein [Massilia sp. Se16.2.3]